MAERKNIKRNATRVKAKDRAYHQSIQHSYYRPKPKEAELTLKLF